MLNAIRVTNEGGRTLTLSLWDPKSSGFIVKNIDGLSAPKGQINMLDIPTGNGSVFNNARATYRTITFEIVLMENPTIENSRRTLYQFFTARKKVRLEFDTGTRLCYIDGYVESNEVGIFSSQETADITVLCPDPYFRNSEGFFEAEFKANVPVFEFPFSNAVGQTELEMSQITDGKRIALDYDGESDTGFEVTIENIDFVRGQTAPDITILNEEYSDRLYIDLSQFSKVITNSTFTAGDKLVISTIPGQKNARLIRNGVSYNAFPLIYGEVHWLTLRNGVNHYAYSHLLSTGNVKVSFRYPVLYEGV